MLTVASSKQKVSVHHTLSTCVFGPRFDAWFLRFQTISSEPHTIAFAKRPPVDSVCNQFASQRQLPFCIYLQILSTYHITTVPWTWPEPMGAVTHEVSWTWCYNSYIVLQFLYCLNQNPIKVK